MLIEECLTVRKCTNINVLLFESLKSLKIFYLLALDVPCWMKEDGGGKES